MPWLVRPVSSGVTVRPNVGGTMTEVRDPQTDESIREAMHLIDRGLGDISERKLFSTSEVADLLLDVRSLLARLDAEVHIN